MKRTIILVTLLTAFISPSIAQKNATTEEGEKVVLYENGTWKYDNNSKDKFIGVWLESHSQNSNSKIELDVEPGTITIKEVNGQLKAVYKGNAYVRKEYKNLMFVNGVIIFDLTYYDEMGINTYTKKGMKFILVNDRTMKTQNHNDTAYNYILTKK